MNYYKLPYILYRDYPDFGYLTDNRNFGYDTASKSSVKVGDRVLSKTGSIFYSVLNEKPQCVEALAKALLPLFVGASFEEIVNDAIEFYDTLVNDGFVGRGDNPSEGCYFSYEDLTPKQVPESGPLEIYDGDFYEKWCAEYHLSRVHLEVSARCNEHCIHCYFPDLYRRDMMSKELFLRILEQSKAAKVLSVTISGGEPLLNPDLLFFIDELRKNEFSINLLSNLTLMTDEMIELLATIPLLSIQTSLYSMEPDIHDSITSIRGSFKKTKQAIEKLHRRNIPMQINCPIMRQNRTSYQSVLKWANELNIEASSDYMLFGCFDGSGKNLDCRLDLHEVEYVVRDEYVMNSRRGNREKKSEHESAGHDYYICPVCLSSICVAHNGDVYPCEGWQSYKLGNINNSSLSQIWDGPLVNELRALSYDDFPKCRICPDKEFCSICLLRNANESRDGNFKELSPYFCSIAHMKRDIAEAFKL